MKNKEGWNNENKEVCLTDDQNQGLRLKDSKSTSGITFGWRICTIDMKNKILYRWACGFE